jgi:hypothetical protein
MILYDNKKVKLLNFLKLGINPFRKFVSTGEIKEELGLVKSRNKLFESIKESLDKIDNRIIPIIGDVGVGKTHLYWTLRYNLYFHNSIYLSLEALKNRFFYTIYSEFIEVLGVDLLRFILNQLCTQWGALERRYGFFHVANIEKARSNALEHFISIYNETDVNSIKDIIDGIIIHQLDPYNKIEAEEWLLGKLMDAKELSRLNMSSDLRKSKSAYLMLRILIENSKLDTVLFIDDFEKIIAIMKPKEESTEEVFDPSWLYGDDKSPDDIESEKILNRLTKLINIKKLHIIITLKSLEALDEIKQKFEEVYPKFILNIGEPLFIENFKEDDIFEFYTRNLNNFYEEMDFKEFIGAFQNEFFPLNKKILKQMFVKTQGNPREIIKSLIEIFNSIIYSDERLDEILENYEKSNSY